jgi:hypothetical protein
LTIREGAERGSTKKVKFKILKSIPNNRLLKKSWQKTLQKCDAWKQI